MTGGVQNLKFVLQQMHTALMALTSYEANDFVANSRWRHGGDCRSDMFRRQEEGNETFCARSFLLDGDLLELQAGIERWESYVSPYEKKMKDKLDDAIKLAGLESLVPEELEKHLILNSSRLRTFEDVRLEVVTYVEAKFGLRFVIPSRVTLALVDIQIPWMLMRSILSRLAKETGHRVRVMGVSSAMEHIFNETAMDARTQVSNRLAKASHGPSHGPRVRAKVRVKIARGNPKENPKVPKARTSAKHRKLVSQVFKNSKPEASSETQESAQTCPTDTSWNDGWNCDEWDDGWNF